jgi:hypothetical protein
MKSPVLVIILICIQALSFVHGVKAVAPALTADSTAPDFHYIDSFAMAAPLSVSKDSSTVAAYLLPVCKNDMDKARAIFAWIAANIRYDDDAFNSGKIAVKSATAVLHTRHAVCEGYSVLYKAIGQAMGLEVQIISGYAKAYGYHPGEKFEGTDPNHDWNAVRVNGHWLLLDVTWGSGGSEGTRGKLVSRKIYTPYWFNTNRYEFLFRHFPEKSDWQLLPQAITLKQYEEMVLIPESLFALGVNGRDMLNKALANELPKQLPEAAPIIQHLKLVDFPLSGVLATNAEVKFTIASDENLEIAVYNDPKDRPVFMKKEGNTYTTSVPLKRGNLQLAVKGKDNRYYDFLIYKVK